MLGVDNMKGGLTRREPLNIRAEPRHDLLEMDVFLRDLWRGDECAFAAANCARATAAHEAQIAYLREAHQQFVENFRVLAQNLGDQVREIRKKFDERIQPEIVKVTSDDIAEALTKRVLTVRTAARGENVDVVIRQASSAEIRASKLF